MLTILIHWIVIAWISFIAGLGVLRVWSRVGKERGDSPPGLDLVVLLGFLACSLLAAWLSVFTGIGWAIKGGLLGTALVLTAVQRQEAVSMLRQALRDWQASSPAIKSVALALFLFSLLCSSIPSHYFDTPLYHSQAIQWIQQFPVVPGLGNLHSRLAYNSHFFLSSALFSTEYSETVVVYPLNGFLFLLTMLRLLFDIGKALSAKDAGSLLMRSVLAVLFLFDSAQYVNTASPDLVISTAAVFAILTFMDASPAYGGGIRRLLLWVILFSAVTFKLSAIYLCVLFPFTVAGREWRKHLVHAFATGMLIAAPFLYRNYVLSGYLIYPVAITGWFDPDWKIPPADVAFEAEYIKKYARLTYAQMSVPTVDEEVVAMEFVNRPVGTWLPEWFGALEERWKAILVINLFTIFPLFASLIRRDLHKATWQFAILFNAVAWFFTAPDPRFAAGILYLGCAATVTFFAQPLLARLKPGMPGIALLALLVLIMGYTGYKSIRNEGWHAKNLLCPSALEAADGEKRMVGKIEVMLAKEGKCYNAPLPCTPVVKEGLTSRGTRPQDGFRIDKPGKTA